MGWVWREVWRAVRRAARRAVWPDGGRLGVVWCGVVRCGGVGPKWPHLFLCRVGSGKLRPMTLHVTLDEGGRVGVTFVLSSRQQLRLRFLQVQNLRLFLWWRALRKRVGIHGVSTQMVGRRGSSDGVAHLIGGLGGLIDRRRCGLHCMQQAQQACRPARVQQRHRIAGY